MPWVTLFQCAWHVCMWQIPFLPKPRCSENWKWQFMLSTIAWLKLMVLFMTITGNMLCLASWLLWEFRTLFICWFAFLPWMNFADLGRKCLITEVWFKWRCRLWWWRSKIARGTKTSSPTSKLSTHQGAKTEFYTKWFNDFNKQFQFQ